MRLRRVLRCILITAAVAAATAAVPASSSTIEAEDDEPIDLDALEASSAEGEPTTPAASTERDRQGDVADQLAAGSGVRVATICTNCNAASLSVNGLSGDRVGVTWDGLGSPGGLASVYWLTQFPSELIGYTGVTRGPGSVLSGPAAFAGTIDFHSLERKERRAWLDVQVGDWGWRQVRAAGVDRWGPVGALVFVQGATEDVYDADGESPNEVADFERVSYQGLFDVHLNEEQVLTFDLSYYGEDQVDGPGAPEIGNPYLNEDAFFNLRRGAIHWDLSKPSGLHVELSTAYTLRKHRQSAPPYTGAPKSTTYRIEEERSQGELRIGRPVGTAGFLTGGLDWDRQRLFVRQAAYLALNGPEWIVDGLELLGLYLQYERSLGSRWDYTIGLRGDRMTVFGQTRQDGDSSPWVGDPDIEHSYLIPRAQVHFRPVDRLVLGLAAGRGIAGPRPVAEETCCGARYVRNRELAAERAWSYQAQAEWKPTPDQRFTTSLFWTDFSDYQEKVVHESNAFIPYYSNVNIQDARVRGIDFVHDMRFKGDLINVGWTWTITEADGLYTYPGSERNPEMWTVEGLRYIPKHAASAYLRYADVRRGTRVNLDLSWQSSVSHFRNGRVEGDFGTRNSDDPWAFLESEDYFQLSLLFEQRIGRKGWSAYAGVNNITDYVMPDLGERESSNDWGPIQGRFVYAGMKFNH